MPGNDEKTAFEAIAHWKDMTPFAWFQWGWKAARAASQPTAKGGERECCNAECGWIGAEVDTVQMKHGYPNLLCPKCHEVTESAAAPQGTLSDEQIRSLKYVIARLEIARVEPECEHARNLRALLAEQSGEHEAAPQAGLTDEQRKALLAVLECADTSERHRTNQAWLNLREAIDAARALLAEQSAAPMAGETRAAAPQAASTPPTPYHWRDSGPLETGE
jgi:hypothetical protein